MDETNELLRELLAEVKAFREDQRAIAESQAESANRGLRLMGDWDAVGIPPLKAD